MSGRARRLGIAIGAAALAVAATSSAESQGHAVQVSAAVPVGEFAEYSNMGWGLDYAYVRRRPHELVGLRAGGGLVVFPGVRDRICDFSPTAGCRDTYEVTTQRSALYAAVGPQFEMEYVPLRPHLFATAGVSAFRSASTGLPSEQNNEQQSVGLDWAAGTGLSLPAGSVTFDFGARVQGGSAVRYAPRGGIGQDDLGQPSFSPRAGPRSVVLITAGVRF